MDNANGNNKRYIYKICTQDKELIINKYLIIYHCYGDYDYREDLIYCVDESSYEKYIRNGKGDDVLLEIDESEIYSLEKLKKDYLNKPACYIDNWSGEYCWNTDEEELRTKFFEWQEIRVENNKQELLKKEEELKAKRVLDKQKMLKQIDKNGDDIIKLGRKIDNVNDKDTKEIITDLINRLKEENEKLMKKLTK